MTAVHGQPLERGPGVPFGLGSLEEDLLVLGMTSGHLVELPTVGELLERVDPRGLEQAVLRVRIRDLYDEQRLRRQARHDVYHLRRVEVGGRDDGAGRLQRDTPGKNGKAAQDGLLDRREELVTPVESRSQRLLARKRRAVPSGQDSEPIVETGSDLVEPERGGPGGCQVGCQGGGRERG